MLSAEDKKKLRELIQRYKSDWRSDAREAAKFQIDKISLKDPAEALKIKSQYGYKDAKMDYKKFIDSVVGNIARKIEDEFNEKDIPKTETEKAANEELEDTSPKKNRLGRNPLEKIDNSDPGDNGVGSIIKKTGK